MGRNVRQVRTFIMDTSLRGRNEPRNGPECRRFSRALGTDEGDDFPFIHFQAAAPIRINVAVGDVHVVEGEHRPARFHRMGHPRSTPLPKYASNTWGSLRTSSGNPWAMTCPKSMTVRRSHMPITIFI